MSLKPKIRGVSVTSISESKIFLVQQRIKICGNEALQRMKRYAHFLLLHCLPLMGKLTLKMLLKYKRCDSDFCSQQSIVGEWRVVLEASSGTSTVLGTSCKWNNKLSHSSVFWPYRTPSLVQTRYFCKTDLFYNCSIIPLNFRGIGSMLVFILFCLISPILSSSWESLNLMSSIQHPNKSRSPGHIRLSFTKLI